MPAFKFHLTQITINLNSKDLKKMLFQHRGIDHFKNPHGLVSVAATYFSVNQPNAKFIIILYLLLTRINIM